MIGTDKNGNWIMLVFGRNYPQHDKLKRAKIKMRLEELIQYAARHGKIVIIYFACKLGITHTSPLKHIVEQFKKLEAPH